jgi:small-conductance mechanosensitive channel/CRP-like cAMP-binding protein
MDLSSDFLQPFALLLALICVTVVFVRVLDAIVRRRHRPVRLGLELLVALGALHLVAHPAFRYVGAEALAGPAADFLALLWWLSLAYLINALLRRFVWEGLLSEGGTRKVPKLLTDAAGLLVYAGAMMVVMHFVYGQPVTSVLLSSGAAAFVVGLSAQSTLKEVFAGISLNATRALRLGDYVEIDGVYGRVHDIDWRSISVHNPHTDSLYIFPNSAVAERVVLNYSEPTERFKNVVTFVVEPSASPELVGRTVLGSLEHSVYVRRDPKPDINMLGFTDLGIEYRIRYYFDGDDPWWDAQNEVVQAIWTSLRRRGLRLAVDRHKLQTGDELELSPWMTPVVSGEAPIVAHLGASDLFAGLTSEALAALAEGARLRDFTPPDCLYRAGEACEHLYVVADGKLALVSGGSELGAPDVDAGEIGAGDLIGLESLLGEGGYTVTVQARQYSRVYELDATTVREQLGDEQRWRGVVQARLEEQCEELAAERSRALEARRHREHRRQRSHLMRHMREHADAFFARPLLHRALGAVMPGHVENTILESMMAACALVATAREALDEAELAYLRAALHDMDVFRHIDAGRGLERFRAHADAIASDPADGREEALRAVGVVAADRHMAEVVMGTAHAMAGLHEQVTEAEHESLADIAARLALPAHPGELLEQTRRRAAGADG